MDDETNVKADFQQLPGLLFFTAQHKFDAPEEVRKQKLAKFAKKYMIWQAICSCGKWSAPFVTTGTVNEVIYLKECLQKCLLPLLKQHEGPTIFWPDLASCHYLNVVRSQLGHFRTQRHEPPQHTPTKAHRKILGYYEAGTTEASQGGQI